MSFPTSMLRQTAVYWAPGSSSPDQFGQVVPTTPVEIACRWEASNEKFLNELGEQCVARAKVFVDQDVELGGLLYLGSLTDVDDSSFPDDPTQAGAVEVRIFAKVPRLRGDNFVRYVLV